MRTRSALGRDAFKPLKTESCRRGPPSAVSSRMDFGSFAFRAAVSARARSSGRVTKTIWRKPLTRASASSDHARIGLPRSLRYGLRTLPPMRDDEPAATTMADNISFEFRVSGFELGMRAKLIRNSQSAIRNRAASEIAEVL